MTKDKLLLVLIGTELLSRRINAQDSLEVIERDGYRIKLRCGGLTGCGFDFRECDDTGKNGEHCYDEELTALVERLKEDDKEFLLTSRKSHKYGFYITKERGNTP